MKDIQGGIGCQHKYGPDAAVALNTRQLSMGEVREKIYAEYEGTVSPTP